MEKNQEKYKAKIARLEKELLAKKRTLKIESSLEKVRNKSMRMKKPHDMLNVCKTISLQLESLGVMQIRNVQTAIFYKHRGSYMNYEYYAKHNKTIITETIYTNHKLHNEFAQKMLKGKGETFITHIKDKKVKDWIAYQKTTNVFIDKYLKTASSLSYYWFSLGPVALGISTYFPLTEDEIVLFKRFLKVFELAYQRYLDIEQAISQAREAKIETVLEKIRSRSLAMRKSDELQEVVRTVFEKLEELNVDFYTVIIIIFQENSKDIYWWMQNKLKHEYPKILVRYEDNPYLRDLFEAKENSMELFSKCYFGNEKNKIYNYLLRHTELKNVPENQKKFLLENEFATMSIAITHNTGIHLTSYSKKSFSAEENEILKRFAKVFEQAYIRFIDLQKAEAQAREAKIEASLERVRAVAMSMHKSDDLLSICEVSFKEFQKLGFENIRNAIIHIPNDEKEFFMDYDFSEFVGGAVTKIKYGLHPIVDDYLKQIRKAEDAFFEVVIKEDQLQGWKEFRKISGQYDDPRLDQTTELYYYLYSIGIGDIGISTFKPIDDSQLIILKRFRNVFDLAYRRYNDITLAEEQARETQIQLALERVRARTMAMHKSEELSEASFVLFKQLEELGEVADQISIGIFNEEEEVFELYATIYGSLWKETGRFPLTKHPVHKKTYTAWKDKKKSTVIDLKGEELKDFNRFKMENSTQYKSEDELPKHRWVIHCAYFSKGVLTFSTHESRPPETLLLLERFAGVFDLTYTRFLDLQKAEAQAREAQIEAALERVRAKAMAMHSSSDLSDTMGVLFAELPKLGISSVRCGVVLLSKNSTQGVFYAAATTQESDSFTMIGNGDMKKHPVFMKQYESWLQKENYFVTLSGEDLQSYYKEIFARLSITYNPREHKLQTEHGYYFSFSEGMFYAWDEKPYSEDEINVLNRFKAIIDLTFRRYLDLQKAEAQAREAQIELALERVRARTMAMQRSEELSEAAYVLFQQFQELGQEPEQFTIGIINEVDHVIEFWHTWLGSPMEAKVLLSIDEPHVANKVYTLWKEQTKSAIIDLSGKDLKEYNIYRKKSLKEVNIDLGTVLDEEQRRIIYIAAFSKGTISISTHEPRPAETIQLLERFAGVFDLTYTRFLDLKTAEAQAREAKIEASLERVRSKTMAMQQSSDLHDVIKVATDQLSELGIKFNVANFAKIHSEGSWDLWISTPEQSYPALVYVPYIDHRIFNNLIEIISKGVDFLADVFDKEEKDVFFKHFFENTVAKTNIPDARKQYIMGCKGFARSITLTKNIWLAVSNYDGIPFSDEENAIFKRFAKVFEQTYTRFLDLQKAEAQAKEAKIEAALERVRSKAMAMHSPNDLSETVNVFFKEIKTIGIIPIRCGVGQIDEATRTTSLTTTTSSQQGDSFQVIGKVKQTGHPVLDGIFDHWKLQKEYHPVLEGEDIKAYYNVMNPQIGYPDYPEGVTQYGNSFPFKEGFVFAWTENLLSEEELIIFRRFTSVLSLTYRRYMDLKEAEARTIESVRQAALDRVRAEIASMRTSEDLNRITPVIWRELKTLGVPFFRCGVYIVDENTESVHVYLTTPDGKSLGLLNMPFDSNVITSNTVNHWRKKEIYKEHWNKQQFINWTKYLVEQNQIPTAESYQGSAEPPDSLDLNFVPFAQGMLYVGDVNPLADEKLELVKSLAESFSIAYARYEDFKNLEEAKNKIETTLNDLKAAQAQLVHSEKMASLGELTAGIAHEIKNPLNFVNNFSEVSRELLDEMKIELQENKIEVVIELVENLKQNLEKINLHGKRADSIVKGMLLHSRGTSGEKVLTNINDLLDQYVTLAYHGLRAQNKEFNITIEKDYDKSLEKINVVPQDISRVFLNLINNGCYAANEKKHNNGDGFVPILKVSTKNLHNRVEIRIRDNGNGIPESIREQIFTPFFSTKPTGEGTGLGLSLSYDIVTKVHNGDIKFESEEGKFTEFIITLPKSGM